MSLLHFFQWMNELAPSVGIRESIWLGAIVNVMHLLSLAVLAGAVLIVDLRLLGGGMKQRPLADVARDAQPWVIGSLLGLLVTGIPQLISNAIREYYSFFFWFKMAVLVLALIYTFTVRRQVTLADEGRVGPAWAKVVGFISIALWAGVAIPARLIGLFT
jgi:putative copper export protein